MRGPGRGRVSARDENPRMKIYLIKDFHKMLGFCWGERRREVWRLFSPRCGGNNEGDKSRFDPHPDEVFGSNRRKVW